MPLLALGFVALVGGVLAGLARLAWPVPALAAAAAPGHGALMIGGFFGVVIALERAVAIGRAWAYAGPLAAGLGALLLLAGAGAPAPWFTVAGAAVLLAATASVWRRQRAMFTLTLVLGAAAHLVAALAWALSASMALALPWWVAFLVLTIAGERLELSRLLPPSAAAARLFELIVAALGLALGGLTAVALAAGAADDGAPAQLASRGFATALLALALWLVRQDVARRTVRGHGLTRYIAVCLLLGYGWLALGALTWLVAGVPLPGTRSHDAALHALFVGFVFSMVFGHAPIILPAVLGVRMRWHAGFYAPLGLLQMSLVVRLLGDALALFTLTRLGALLNAIALGAFIANAALSVWVARGPARSG